MQRRDGGVYVRRGKSSPFGTIWELGPGVELFEVQRQLPHLSPYLHHLLAHAKHSLFLTVALRLKSRCLKPYVASVKRSQRSINAPHAPCHSKYISAPESSSSRISFEFANIYKLLPSVFQNSQNYPSRPRTRAPKGRRSRNTPASRTASSTEIFTPENRLLYPSHEPKISRVTQNTTCPPLCAAEHLRRNHRTGRRWQGAITLSGRQRTRTWGRGSLDTKAGRCPSNEDAEMDEGG